MKHSFNVEIATKYGMMEAVLLEHLNFWISKNKANGVNFYDGKHWTYSTTKAFAELFPYISQKTISRALHHLEEEGIIICGNYNKSSYDRTIWYAITEKGNLILQNDQLEVDKMTNGSGQNVQMEVDKMTNGSRQNVQMEVDKMTNRDAQNDQPIPDISTDINTDVITVSKDTVRQTESVRRIVAAWNQLEVYGIKSIIKLSSKSKRYDCLVARLKEYGEENILKAIENIKQSNFLQGKSSDRRKWFITFDWFVLPNNFPKVLEGNYSNDNMVSESNGTKYDKDFQKKSAYNNYPQNPLTAEKESHNPDIFEQLINESRADVMERKGE